MYSKKNNAINRSEEEKHRMNPVLEWIHDSICLVQKNGFYFDTLIYNGYEPMGVWFF